MIDRWSIIHCIILVFIGIAQVIILRRFFNVGPIPQRLKTKT